MNKELEAFAYSISHDLRAPVRAIKGIAQLFEEEYASGMTNEEREYLTRISASSEKMNELIEGLLTLSYMGQQDLTLQKLDLSQMAEKIFADIRELDTSRQIHLQTPDQLEITGDRQLVTAMMTNLISNAAKFTRGCESALIEIGTETKNDRQVVFVRDNGIGFEMNYAEKLFEPFNRLNTESEIEGTGVGLAIVKRVVQRHNGQIWVESRPGEGATFYFYLSD
jgi:light-regulated signal transduction histidine kinase (bacteriophytochrome)